MNPEIKKILGELKNTSHGQALRKYLESRRDDLNDLSRLFGPEDMVEKRGMVKMIKELLGFYGDNTPVDKKSNQQYT